MSAFTQRKFWIFDLDGTLTIPVHDFIAIKRELGLDLGTDILTSMAALSESEHTEKREVLRKIELELAENAQPAPGGQDLLAVLSQRDCTLGILTRNSVECAWITLRAIGLHSFFDEGSVIGRESANPKPDPGGIFKLLSLWGAEPQHSIMVGDFLYDMSAGKSAGTATIHVDSGDLGDWPNVTDLKVSNLNQITDHLLGKKTGGKLAENWGQSKGTGRKLGSE